MTSTMAPTAVFASVTTHTGDDVEENISVETESSAAPNNAKFGPHHGRTLHKKKSSNDLRDEFYQASFEASQLLQSKEGELASPTS